MLGNHHCRSLSGERERERERKRTGEWEREGERERAGVTCPKIESITIPSNMTHSTNWKEGNNAKNFAYLFLCNKKPPEKGLRQ